MVSRSVIFVDTKKKELIGDFKAARRAWQPEPVRVHDFIVHQKGKAIPYGVYDLTRNAGWVSVGIDHDSASFAARTIRQWWRQTGRPRHSRTRTLLITADCRSSNGARVRLWRRQLQQLANQIGLAITVCHLPPGTEQMEQGRAPALRLHQQQLARAPAREVGGDRQPDRRHPTAAGSASAVSWIAEPIRRDNRSPDARSPNAQIATLSARPPSLPW